MIPLQLMSESISAGPLFEITLFNTISKQEVTLYGFIIKNQIVKLITALITSQQTQYNSCEILVQH